MLFTLEALEAAHGDCLLLHYGTTQSPRAVVIDGGPPGVYGRHLEPRLLALRDSRAPGQALPIPLLAISHIDEDHIQGALAMTREMRRAKDDGDPAVFNVLQLWHNSFDDMVKPVKANVAEVRPAIQLAETAQPLSATFASVAPDDTKLVLASVAQGRQLRADAQRLGIPMNSGFADGFIVTPASGVLKKNVGSGLTLTIVGPRQEQLDALQGDWAKYIKKARKNKKLKPAEVMEAAAADFVDKSVYNLSSIVLLAESGGKTMLLTGDARGDYVIQALEEAKLKEVGKAFHVDVLKVPHHGSWRNLSDSFLREVTADHYVFSANGKYDNPDKPSMQSLLKVRPKGGYTIYLTNRKHVDSGSVLPAAAYLDKAAKPKNVDVVYANDADQVPRIVIDLGDPLAD